MLLGLRVGAIAVFLIGIAGLWLAEERWGWTINLAAMAVGAGLSIVADVISSRQRSRP